jgi:hypothetical protein
MGIERRVEWLREFRSLIEQGDYYRFRGGLNDIEDVLFALYYASYSPTAAALLLGRLLVRPTGQLRHWGDFLAPIMDAWEGKLKEYLERK